jgi:hypothetical protein
MVMQCQAAPTDALPIAREPGSGGLRWCNSTWDGTVPEEPAQKERPRCGAGCVPAGASSAMPGVGQRRDAVDGVGSDTAGAMQQVEREIGAAPTGSLQARRQQIAAIVAVQFHEAAEVILLAVPTIDIKDDMLAAGRSSHGIAYALR